MRALIPLLLLIVGTPLVALAQVTAVAQVLGLFNIFVGVLLTISLLLYMAGAAMWATRLGTWPTYRTEAIRVLEWAVATLFVLNVLLFIVQLFENHQDVAHYVLSALIVLFVAWLIYKIVRSESGGEKKKEEH